MKPLAAALLALVLSLGSAVAEDGRQVTADVQRLIEATYTGDVPVVVSYTYPKIITAMGGAVQATAAVQNALAQVEAMGLELVSLEVSESPKIIEAREQRYAVVRTRLVINARGDTIVIDDFQFGIETDDGWKFIEGSRVNDEMLISWFPDFPRDYGFPPTSRKKL